MTLSHAVVGVDSLQLWWVTVTDYNEQAVMNSWPGLLLKHVSWMVANNVLYKTSVLQTHGCGFGQIPWNDQNSVNGHDVLT
jgi:hypothetical protein